jgi:hypothetical protein
MHRPVWLARPIEIVPFFGIHRGIQRLHIPVCFEKAEELRLNPGKLLDGGIDLRFGGSAEFLSPGAGGEKVTVIAYSR